MKRKSFASISTPNQNSATTCYFVVCVCVWVCVCLYEYVRLWICLHCIFMCVCLVFVSSLHFPPTATNHLKSKWSKCAFQGRNKMFGLLWTSQPHLETLFLEDQRKPTEKCFGGNKQTIQQLDQPEPQESLDWQSCSTTAPTLDYLL